MLKFDRKRVLVCGAALAFIGATVAVIPQASAVISRDDNGSSYVNATATLSNGASPVGKFSYNISAKCTLTSIGKSKGLRAAAVSHSVYVLDPKKSGSDKRVSISNYVKIAGDRIEGKNILTGQGGLTDGTLSIGKTSPAYVNAWADITCETFKGNAKFGPNVTGSSKDVTLTKGYSIKAAK